MTNETYRRAILPNRTPEPLPLSNAPAGAMNIFNNCHISYGIPFQLACAAHLESTFHASRAYILASRTLACTTSALDDLKDTLKDKVAGVKIGLKAHTSWNDVLEMRRECLELNVDVIITLGGGSLTDAAKLLSLVYPII
jgi:alcohol dehydrogenase class IV